VTEPTVSVQFSFPANGALGGLRDVFSSLGEVSLLGEMKVFDGFRDRNGSPDDIVALLVDVELSS
jgi:hypothetical protein